MHKVIFLATPHLTDLKHKQLTPFLLICQISSHAHIQIVSIKDFEKVSACSLKALCRVGCWLRCLTALIGQAP
jgi:hypothetical protein